jgi:hypothetical protein
MPAGSDRYVLLKGGLAVPLEPLRLLLDLESRGFTVFREDGDVVVLPGNQLTDDDCRQIRGWKPHLLALLDYPEPEVPH